MSLVIEKALQVLEEGFYDPSFFELEVALADLGFAGVANFDTFAKEVFKEACKRTSEALRGLWKAIGVPPPPRGGGSPTERIQTGSGVFSASLRRRT
jgi:hypothetical protein